MANLVTIGLITIARLPEPLQQRRRHLLELVESAGRQGCQLVALPELADHHRTEEALAAYAQGCEAVRQQMALTAESPWVREIRALAKTYGMIVIPNLALAEQERLYDSALVIGPDGELLGRYDKTHLAGGESRFFDPGQHIVPIATPLGKVGIIICYDIHFPELTRCYELQGADLLLWTTMRHGELEQSLFRTILPARCLTHHLPLAVTTYLLEDQIHSDNPMSSCLLDGHGRIVAGSVQTPGVLRATLDLDARPTMQPIWNQPQRVDAGTLLRSQRRPELYGVLGQTRTEI